MDAGFFRTRGLTCGFAVLLAMTVVSSTHGSSAYLQQIGPVPLRFAEVSAHLASLALPSLLAEKRISKVASTTAPVEPGTNITELAKAPSQPATTNSVAELAATTSEPEANSTLPLVTPSTARDLLVFSPQMLTEYFKPATQQTNSAIVVPIVPRDVVFTPPEAKLSSQAIYKTE